jgi:hypothetical protein
MANYKINLEAQTATSINGITFKMTRHEDGKYSGVCLNPKEIPPDDLEDVILERMVRDAGIYYDEALKWGNRTNKGD